MSRGSSTPSSTQLRKTPDPANSSSVSEGEFAIIREIFAPLAANASGAFALTDDAAIVSGGDHVVTADMMVAGVHFRKNDPLDLVARKLLRVNLSDLAAKGAKPNGYILTCAWPRAAKRADIALFAEGLATDQEMFRIALFGGDTTRHAAADAPLTVSATFFGAAPRQGMVRRAGAAVGDDVYVSGTIGDARLGLEALEKRVKFSPADRTYFGGRYHLPEPRVTLGGALSGFASAAIDVSDGLVADAGHIAETSNCAISINAAAMPLSEQAKRWLEKQEDQGAAVAFIATGGDDYEILFTASPRARRAIEMASTVSKTPVTRIGTVGKGAGVTLLGADGGAIELAAGGFDHFTRG